MGEGGEPFFRLLDFGVLEHSLLVAGIRDGYSLELSLNTQISYPDLTFQCKTECDLGTRLLTPMYLIQLAQ